MPRNWTRLLRWMRMREPGPMCSSPLDGPDREKTIQPAWLTPAYLRQLRSGDRISR